MADFHYIGSELDTFAHATNWKSYVRAKVRPYLAGDVLEVGAGIGAVTRLLCDGTQKRWVCLEPDRALAERIKADAPPKLEACEVIVGALSDLDTREMFDAILYMDVLEHIEDDRTELARAAQHLKPGGTLLILAPALPWLFTPFDSAIGHYRRYTKDSLHAIAPQSVREEEIVYLDAVGMMASAGNRLFLHSATPTVRQILFWDRFLVPASRFVDKVLAYSLGRSVLAIWHNTGRGL